MFSRILLVALSLCLCISLPAQTTAERASKRAKNRAENRANNKVDRKVDEAVDEAFDAIGGLFKKKKKQPAETQTPDGTGPEATTPATTGGLFGGGKWEPFTNPVPLSVDMEVTEIKGNGKEEKSQIRMAVTENEVGLRMSSDRATEGHTRMILDTQTGKTTVVTTDKKGEQSAIRMRIPKMGKVVAESAEEVNDRFTFEATGERRTIDGYDCEKYIVRDTQEGTTTESWVTQDLEVSAADIFAGFAALSSAPKGPNPNALAGGYQGFPIESVTTDGKKTFRMTFRNIKVGTTEMDRAILDLTGVEVQDFGF